MYGKTRRQYVHTSSGRGEGLGGLWSICYVMLNPSIHVIDRLEQVSTTLQSSFLLTSPKKIYQVFQPPLPLIPYLGSTGCHPLASFPSAPVLHLLKEPGHSYVFLALGNSKSVNVTLALCCLKNYPMFASSVATSSSCCISSEMTLDHYQCN